MENSGACLMPCNHVGRLNHTSVLSLSLSGADVGVPKVRLRGEESVIIRQTTDVSDLLPFFPRVIECASLE